MSRCFLRRDRTRARDALSFGCTKGTRSAPSVNSMVFKVQRAYLWSATSPTTKDPEVIGEAGRVGMTAARTGLGQRVPNPLCDAVLRCVGATLLGSFSVSPFSPELGVTASSTLQFRSPWVHVFCLLAWRGGRGYRLGWWWWLCVCAHLTSALVTDTPQHSRGLRLCHETDFHLTW